MAEYIDDYDDEGNPIRIKVTKALLRTRIDDLEDRLATQRGATTVNRARAEKAENRLKAIEFGELLADAIGEGPTPFVVQAALDITQDYVDVSIDAMRQVLPGTRTARLTVEYQGDPAVLERLGKCLMEAR